MNIQCELEKYNTCELLIKNLYGDNSNIINDIPIIFSNDTPAILKPTDKNPKPEINYREVNICNLLGVYYGEKQIIKIYPKQIALVSNRLDIDYIALTQVVIIHELSHYLSHKLEINGKTWDTDEYIKPNTSVHEFLAQLSTYLVIRDNEKLYNAFSKLSTKQSSEYTRYKLFAMNEVRIDFYFDILIGLRSKEDAKLHDIGEYIYKRIPIEKHSTTNLTTFFEDCEIIIDYEDEDYEFIGDIEWFFKDQSGCYNDQIEFELTMLRLEI